MKLHQILLSFLVCVLIYSIFQFFIPLSIRPCICPNYAEGYFSIPCSCIETLIDPLGDFYFLRIFIPIFVGYGLFFLKFGRWVLYFFKCQFPLSEKCACSLLIFPHFSSFSSVFWLGVCWFWLLWEFWFLDSLLLPLWSWT
jgi:hypothetical protein